MFTDPTSPGKEEVVSASPDQTPTHKKLSRRKVLALAGGGILLLVAGGGVWRAADQGVFSTGQGPAYEPWDDWRTATKGPLDLVRAAILAANPHNTQPWLFQVTPSYINLFADRRRNIGSIDPFLREMHIGLGCALENLLLAAAANGYTTQVTLLPDASDVTLVARIDLAPGVVKVSDLYNVIAQRHTNRYPYDTAEYQEILARFLFELSHGLRCVALEEPCCSRPAPSRRRASPSRRARSRHGGPRPASPVLA